MDKAKIRLLVELAYKEGFGDGLGDSQVCPPSTTQKYWRDSVAISDMETLLSDDPAIRDMVDSELVILEDVMEKLEQLVVDDAHGIAVNFSNELFRLVENYKKIKARKGG